ncbi:MAG: hypothetical protein FWF68_00750 [Spirochaetes bacterium]|nr:hypothetical protein [Spirochaetota bacterium]
MAYVKCMKCGRMYDTLGPVQTYDKDLYCSARCARAAGASTGTDISFAIIGLVLAALAGMFVEVFYKIPKKLKAKNIKFFYAYIITLAVLLIGTVVVYFTFLSPEAVSGIKIKTVSTSCETEENFVSLLQKSLSGVSGTLIEGEEFKTYSQKALKAVIERESLFTDSVYFVKLPDGVNVYVWFKTKDETTGYIYKTNKKK